MSCGRPRHGRKSCPEFEFTGPCRPSSVLNHQPNPMRALATKTRLIGIFMNLKERVPQMRDLIVSRINQKDYGLRDLDDASYDEIPTVQEPSSDTRSRLKYIWDVYGAMQTYTQHLFYMAYYERQLRKQSGVDFDVFPHMIEGQLLSWVKSSLCSLEDLLIYLPESNATTISTIKVTCQRNMSPRNVNDNAYKVLHELQTLLEGVVRNLNREFIFTVL